MDSQAFNVARAVWSVKLVTSYFIDVGRLSQAVCEALPSAARAQHTAAVVSALLTSDLAILPDRAGGWYRTEGDHEFLGVHIFVRRYSRWIKSLGESLGFDTSLHLMEDDWVTDSFPELQAVLFGLMDRVRSDLSEARAISNPGQIAELFKTARQSVENGEHPNQTHVRSAYITHGLRRVC